MTGGSAPPVTRAHSANMIERNERIQPRHVVIIGGGFAGIYAARKLANAPVRITLIDKENHHLFQPLLYQVATAALNPSDIASPIRSILRGQRNATVILGDVTKIDRERRSVSVNHREIRFDYLMVATGATHSYFGNDAWQDLAPGLKTIDDALEIRRRVLLAYEAAEQESDPEKRRAWMTFVVVGAGPTGVELAGALSEIARHAMSRDFRNINPSDARVILVDAVDEVLPVYPSSLSRSARRQLERLGVEIRTGAMVSDMDETGVTAGGERIEARTRLWAAGVMASPLVRSLGVPLDKAGRVLVNQDLTIPGDDSIYIAGDLAAVKWENDWVPGVAPAAIQEGRHVARNIVRTIEGRPLEPFQYLDKGSLATIGRAAAVADIRGLHLSGWVAWMAWLVVHVFFLIGFRNRVLVVLQWAFAYITHRRGARLIT